MKRKSEKNVRLRLLLAVGAVAIAVVGGIAAYHLLLDDGVALGRRRFWFPDPQKPLEVKKMGFRVVIR